MKILITGAAGFVGSHLAEQLCIQGHIVRGIDSLDPYYSPQFKAHTFETIKSRGVETRVCDLVKDDLIPVLEDMEIVFHLAAQPGNSTSVPFETYLRNNFVATERLVAACELQGSLQAFVNISTSSVYGLYATSSETAPPEPISNYGVTKLAAEQLVLSKFRDHGFPACSLRLFSVYGERERPDKLFPKLIRALASNSPLTVFEGSEEHQRSFTYVGDAIQGFIAVLDNWEKAQGEIFNMGSDQWITTREGIQIVEKMMEKKVAKEILPKRPGDQIATHANITKAREILNYNPAVSPEEGLRRMVKWYLSEIEGKVDYC